MVVRRRPTIEVEAPGQDSFLDVVCNLVGILIVLVMLIAAQAKRGMIAAATAQPVDTAAAEQEKDAKEAEHTAAAIEASVQELQARIHRQNLEAPTGRQASISAAGDGGRATIGRASRAAFDHDHDDTT
jgi:hypothetical protein